MVLVLSLRVVHQGTTTITAVAAVGRVVVVVVVACIGIHGQHRAVLAVPCYGKQGLDSGAREEPTRPRVHGHQDVQLPVCGLCGGHREGCDLPAKGRPLDLQGAHLGPILDEDIVRLCVPAARELVERQLHCRHWAGGT